MNTILKKLSEILDSRNALVTIASIVLLLFSANNIAINASADELVDLLYGRNLGEIASVLVLNFLNPIFKLGKKFVDKSFNWSFLTSSNFLAQLSTLLTLIVAALWGEGLAGVIVATVIQIYNLAIHVFQKPKHT